MQFVPLNHRKEKCFAQSNGVYIEGLNESPLLVRQG